MTILIPLIAGIVPIAEGHGLQSFPLHSFDIATILIGD